MVAISESRASGFERPPRKSEQTRTAILQGALEFLRVRPYRDMTVATLMQQVGASRPAFYQYFRDLPDLMAELLQGLRSDILSVAAPWFRGEGDPVPLLKISLAGLVDLCVERGSLLRAVNDAAVSDASLEKTWAAFLGSFDDAVALRIEQHQAHGYIDPFPAGPVAVALNRLDASLLTEYFGSQPYGDRDEVLAALVRLWCSTLYGVSGE